MADMKNAVITEIQAARDGVLDILSGGQNTDGQAVDAHITTAAEMLDEALNRLEQERDADSAKAGDAGHQIRVCTLIQFIKGDFMYAMEPDDIEVLLKPMSFDPAIPILLKRICGWNSRCENVNAKAAEIFGDVIARSNAISVLKTQRQEVRGLCSAMDNAESAGGDAAVKAFDAVLDALESWNDDMTRYGG